MARIAPKDLREAIAAAQPGDHLELDGGEHVGQVVIDKPLVIEGRGATTWLGNRTGPVLIIRCAGVELRDLQIEMTGELEHPAILAESHCEPVLRNVAIRRGELHVEGVLLDFAPPPAIRLRASDPEEALAAAEATTAEVASVGAAEANANANAVGAPKAPAKPSAMSPRTVTSLALPPPPPQPVPSVLSAGIAPPPMAVALPSGAPAKASAASQPAAAASPMASHGSVGSTASATAKPASSRAASSPRAGRYGLAGICVLALGSLAWFATTSRDSAQERLGATMALEESAPSRKRSEAAVAATEPHATSATSQPLADPSTTPDPPPPALDLAASSEQRTGIELVGWSPDEERFLVEITYGRDRAEPARWRVRALVDAASERVLRWEDVSAAPARVLAGERENPPWSKEPEALAVEGFQPGSELEPAQLDVRWCGNRKARRAPTRARPLGRELELSWGAGKAQLAPSPCRRGDFGQVLVQVKGSPWRLMRFLPWKGDISTVRVHRSPSGRRAVVIASFRLGDKRVTRFYTRLLGPQIHIVSSNAERRDEALRALGTPGLFMSENARAPIPAPSRIWVRAGDEETLRVARSIQERLAQRFGLAEIEQVSARRAPLLSESTYLWGDILIVLK